MVDTFTSCEYTCRVKELGCSLSLFACHVRKNRYDEYGFWKRYSVVDLKKFQKVSGDTHHTECRITRSQGKGTYVSQCRRNKQ